MKKHAPAPPSPLAPLKHTASHAFGEHGAEQQPLFAVREGLSAEPALIQVSRMLQGAIAVADEIENIEGPDRRLLLTMTHMVEASLGVVEALLKGIPIEKP